MKINLDGEKYNFSVGKVILNICLVVILLSIIFLIIKIILFPVNTAHTVANTAQKVMTKTLDVDNVISNYEWFEQQYEDYQAIQNKLVQAKADIESFEKTAGERINWTFEDKNEYSRLTTIASGIQYQMEDIKAQYNAKSKMGNRNIFKSKNLPYQIGE